MATYPLATLAPTVSNTGISAPQYSDIYQSLIATFQNIYGSDIYVAPDSQDGQFLAVIAAAINDSNQAMISVFQGYSPYYAQGTGLSAQVKLNGLTRLTATNSSAVGVVTGVVGTIITNGVVQDAGGNLWSLPTSVTIPTGGSISVTVTAQQPGSISATVGTINQIYNPQVGWQTFSNTSAAVAGQATETDAALRIRQAASVATPALAVRDAIYAAIGAVTGVERYTVYENPTASTDANGVPAHAIACVVEGGSVAAITSAIFLRKPPGIQTYGTTSYTQTSPLGLSSVINYFVLGEVNIYFAVTIKALPGYLSTTTADIISALVAYVKSLVIGESVYVSQTSAIASMIGLPEGQTFYITDFRLGTAASPTGTSNIAIAYNQGANCAASNITVTVT
jgi:uncharacterized phage protein gp47/JayE